MTKTDKKYRCKHIFIKGKNKGKRCKMKIVNDSNAEQKCCIHKTRENVIPREDKPKCAHIFQRGPKKGQQCKTNPQNNTMCSRHREDKMTYLREYGLKYYRKTKAASTQTE